MKNLEAPWTLGESVDGLTLLQGNVINLLPVLERNIPHHVHYHMTGFPLRQMEPTKVWEQIRPFVGQPGTEETLRRIYSEYFKQEDVESNVEVGFNNDGRLWVLADPKYNYYHSPVRLWSPQKAVSIFPWIDFAVSFEMSEKTKAEAPGRSEFSIGIDTTRSVGQFYEVNIPVNGDRKLLQIAQDMVCSSAVWYGLPANHWGLNDFVIKPHSQRLLSDLLAARVT